MNDHEYWHKRFVETEGKEPENYMQLQSYVLALQDQSKHHSEFWKGVFGL